MNHSSNQLSTVLHTNQIIEENNQELNCALISLIGLNLHDGLWRHSSNHNSMKVENALNADISFLRFNKPDMLIYAWDETTCHITHHDFILIKHPSDFDDYLVGYIILPIEDEHPFLLLVKEVDFFKVPKAKRSPPPSCAHLRNFQKSFLKKGNVFDRINLWGAWFSIRQYRAFAQFKRWFKLLIIQNHCTCVLLGFKSVFITDT